MCRLLHKFIGNLQIKLVVNERKNYNQIVYLIVAIIFRLKLKLDSVTINCLIR
jgi:hypothetical protein